jgi:hypothetical protein
LLAPQKSAEESKQPVALPPIAMKLNLFPPVLSKIEQPSLKLTAPAPALPVFKLLISEAPIAAEVEKND